MPSLDFRAVGVLRVLGSGPRTPWELGDGLKSGCTESADTSKLGNTKHRAYHDFEAMEPMQGRSRRAEKIMLCLIVSLRV